MIIRANKLYTSSINLKYFMINILSEFNDYLSVNLYGTSFESEGRQMIV